MELALTKYCILRDNRFLVNGTLVYENHDIPHQDFLVSLYRTEKVSYLKFFKMDELSKAGFITSELLLKDTPIYGTEPKTKTGLIICNRSSSKHTDENYQDTIGETYFPSPSIFVYTLPNIVMGEIAIRHKIYGENTFFVSEKFDSQLVYDYICQLFSETDHENVITGWVDYDRLHCEVFLMLVERVKDGDKPSTKFDIKTINSLYKS